MRLPARPESFHQRRTASARSSSRCGWSSDTGRIPLLAEEGNASHAISSNFHLLRVHHKLPEVAIGIPEIHARCGSPRAVNVTWRTDVIDSAVPQVLLCFLNRAAPDQAEVSVSGQGDIGQVEFVVGADILRLVLRSQNVLLVDVDFLVIANLDGYLPLSPAPAIFIN